MKKIILISLLAIIMMAFKSDTKATLIITISNIEHNEGNINVIVFKGADGFPSDPKKAVYTKTLAAKGSMIILKVPDLSYGSYAVVVLHDINKNGNADKNFLGIPTEPFGFSNYTSITQGKPSFEEVSFNVKSPRKEITVELIEI